MDRFLGVTEPLRYPDVGLSRLTLRTRSDGVMDRWPLLLPGDRLRERSLADISLDLDLSLRVGFELSLS